MHVLVGVSLTSSDKDNIMAKVVLSSLLPILLIAVCIVCLFWLYRQRSQHFLLQQRQQQCADEPVNPASSLLGHPSNSPTTAHFDLRLVELKARGRFGSVWKAELAGGDAVAVKVFPKHDRQSWLSEQRFYALPRAADCANILQFVGAESRDDELWLLTEYHDAGSLYDHLKAQTVSLSQLARVALSIANGLAFLHSDVNGKPSVAHRDIKSRNVLLRRDMSACIADFGLAVVLEGQPRDAFPQVCNALCSLLLCNAQERYLVECEVILTSTLQSKVCTLAVGGKQIKQPLNFLNIS